MEFLHYLLAYAFLVLGVSIWSNFKGDRKENFLIANRQASWLQICLSKVVGAIGVAWFLTYTAYTYQYGWSIGLVMVFSAISYAVFALWAVPRIHKNSNKGSFYTPVSYTHLTLPTTPYV